MTQLDLNKLDKLAYLSIKKGVNIQPGQDLLITASIESLPLVRKLVDYAYKEGAGVVTPILTDPHITKSRFQYATDQSFDRTQTWLYEGIKNAFKNNTARLAVVSEDPQLLSNFDSDKVSRASKATSLAYKPALEYISNFEINWNIISYPGKAWAKLVFPDLSDEEAVKKLGDAIFHASRIINDDPLKEWDDHNKKLKSKAKWMNEMNFESLLYTGPGTNLEVNLAVGHEWVGGSTNTKKGIPTFPNMPTEEIFTTPHCKKVNGTVRSTKPLSYQGSLIENIEVEFKNGKIIKMNASNGKDVFSKVLKTDEGASQLGEIALVPHSSPISQTGLVYYNTLYDENSSCHLAIGQCYSKCFKDKSLTKDQVIANGGNSSLIHIDWMIGSDKIDISGKDHNGNLIAIFKQGEWCN